MSRPDERHRRDELPADAARPRATKAVGDAFAATDGRASADRPSVANVFDLALAEEASEPTLPFEGAEESEPHRLRGPARAARAAAILAGFLHTGAGRRRLLAAAGVLAAVALIVATIGERPRGSQPQAQRQPARPAPPPGGGERSERARPEPSAARRPTRPARAATARPPRPERRRGPAPAPERSPSPSPVAPAPHAPAPPPPAPASAAAVPTPAAAHASAAAIAREFGP